MPNLQELPLPLAIIVAAFWLINQNNAEFSKKLVALIADFTSKYEALLETISEDRRLASARWLERDRLLSERVDRNTIAQEKNAHETHALRGMITPLVLLIEAERRREGRDDKPGTRRSGVGNSDATE